MTTTGSAQGGAAAASETTPNGTGSTPQSPPEPSQDASSTQQQPQANDTTPQPDQNDLVYKYMFEREKTPSQQLIALLEAIAKHIIDNIGGQDLAELRPKKLAAFYHAVGGDYDSLFVNAPDKSISYIWQALGVQHVLVQAEDFSPPSIPALTVRGFVRWESLQILLGPEEHVPFIQFAVRHWDLRHPTTGQRFPPDLPASVFPKECDPAIDKWHRDCARNLREKANSSEEDSQPEPKRPIPRDPRIHSAYSHVRSSARPSPGPARPEQEYFNRARPSSYAHVPSVPRYKEHDYNSRRSVDERRTTDHVPDDVPRRRSYSDLHSPVEPHKNSDRANSGAPHSFPRRPPPPIHQNASRPQVSSSSDSEEELILPRHGPQARTYGPTHPVAPPATVRRVPHGPVPPQVVPMRPRRSEARSADDTRRRSLRSELSNKLTSFLPGSSDRFRSTSRDRRATPVIVPSRSRSGKASPTSRRSRSVSEDSASGKSESNSVLQQRKATERDKPRDYRDREHERERDREWERDRERDRERERARDRDRLRDRERKRETERARERHDEREPRNRKDNSYLRPDMERRTSSHADIDRRAPRDNGWDPRDRGRRGDRDHSSRRNLSSDERAQHERERRRHNDRPSPSRGSSPAVTTGVHGRRYPQEPRYL